MGHPRLTPLPITHFALCNARIPIADGFHYLGKNRWFSAVMSIADSFILLHYFCGITARKRTMKHAKCSTVLFVMRCFYIAKQLAMVLVFAPGQKENPTRAAEGGEIYEGTGET